MFTTQQAWLFIAKEFDKLVVDGIVTSYNNDGLCHAKSYLYFCDQITSTQAENMHLRIQQALSEGQTYLAPIDREHAALRATIARQFAAEHDTPSSLPTHSGV